MYTGAYGPQVDSDKIIFLQELTNICQRNNYPWIIAGDFNIIRDLAGTTGNSMNLGIMQAFSNLIDNLGLIDVPLHGKIFTWSNKRPIPTFSRLDRTLISHHWEDCDSSYSLKRPTGNDLRPCAASFVNRATQPTKKENFPILAFLAKIPWSASGCLKSMVSN